MWFGLSLLDHFVPQVLWEWNVYQAVAVHMTNFAAAHAEFRAAKTMRCLADSLPGRHHGCYFLSCPWYRHKRHLTCLDGSHHLQAAATRFVSLTYVDFEITNKVMRPEQRVC